MNLRFWRIGRLYRRGSELEEEIASHLRMAAQERVEHGAAPEKAAEAARRELGNATLVRETTRDQWGWRWLEDLLQDFRFAAHGLRRSPGFALTIVLTLALGVGANVTMLGVVRMLLFHTPVHVLHPENVMRVNAVDKGGNPPIDTANYPGYQRLAGHLRLLNLAAQGFPYATDFGHGAAAREVQRNYVSHNYFDVLGTKLLLGRPFSAEEETRTGGDSVAILGYGFWQQEFHGDPRVLGQEVSIDGRPHAIIGIAPQGFTGMDPTAVDMWLPLGDSPILSSAGAWWLQLIGRPVRGATPQQAAAEATNVFLHSGGTRTDAIRLTRYSSVRQATINFRVEANAEQVALWLSGVAFLVFLIACANVANLFFVRAIQRRQETAVRLQLGATRWRLVRQFLVESLLASAMGGAAALVLAYWARPLVQTFLLPPHFYMGYFLSPNTIVLTGCFAVVAGVASGLWPAWRASRPDLSVALKSGGHALHERSTMRSVLLVGQVALTLLLSIGAALFVRSLRSVHAIQLGFDARHVLVAMASTSGYKPADIDAAYEQMRQRAQSLPGIQRAAIAAFVPFFSDAMGSVRVGRPGTSHLRDANAIFNLVSPDYFAAMGMRIVKGRGFLNTDVAGAPSVAVVSESFAHNLGGSESILNQCVFNDGGKDCVRIVGVVPDENRSLNPQVMMGYDGKVYVPLNQASGGSGGWSFPAGGLVMRTKGDPSRMEHEVAAALAGVAPGGRYVDVQPIMAKIDQQTLSWRMGASMFTLFGALALTLSAIGVYGMLAFLVRYRTAEIGLRLALGAMPGDILALVFRRGMLLVGSGIAIGAGAAVALARLMKSLLYGIAPTDATSYAIAAAVVVIVALAACWIPARRAMRVNPMVALRHE